MGRQVKKPRAVKDLVDRVAEAVAAELVDREQEEVKVIPLIWGIDMRTGDSREQYFRLMRETYEPGGNGLGSVVVLMACDERGRRIPRGTVLEIDRGGWLNLNPCISRDIGLATEGMSSGVKVIKTVELGPKR